MISDKGFGRKLRIKRILYRKIAQYLADLFRAMAGRWKSPFGSANRSLPAAIPAIVSYPRHDYWFLPLGSPFIGILSAQEACKVVLTCKSNRLLAPVHDVNVFNPERFCYRELQHSSY